MTSFLNHQNQLFDFLSRSPHITLSHQIWKEHLKQGSHVLDATVGNGHDAAFVSPLIFPGGRLIALDIQASALQKSKELLGDQYPIEWVLQSHATYPNCLDDTSLDLVIFNLGYLPGSDKECITQSETTITSLKALSDKLKKGGVLSITTYSGHPGGQEEEQAVENFVSSLERHQFGVISVSWPNRPQAPKLFIAKKL